MTAHKPSPPEQTDELDRMRRELLTDPHVRIGAGVLRDWAREKGAATDIPLAYATARCNRRQALDRYQHTLAEQNRRTAQRLFSNADRTTWPMLDAVMEVMDLDQSITNPEEVMRRARDMVA